MSKLTFPEISQQTKDQLIILERSQKVERRLHVRAGIILVG
ncbi:MAG TPA: hypothetical protein VK074_07520 [Fodinibius sp.]|nr:hypothetical protein [Fodinibius sp.]